MQRVGIADLGSNTARLVVYEYEPQRRYRMLEAIREPVRLGEGLASQRRLSSAAIRRALAAVELFEDYAVASDLDALEILATSAVREADNRDQVLDPIRRNGYSVRVVAGEEEAELGVLAVANGFAIEDGWVIDLGGGSAQLSRMSERRYESGSALPLGAVRLTERFLLSDPPTEAEVAELEAFVATELGDLAAKIRRSGLPLVGMGGTVRNLARLEMKRREYPLAVIHGYRLTAAGLEEITEDLLSKTLQERVETAGIRPYRADVLVAGALAFRWLLRATGLERIEISGHGIREGAFYRHLLIEPYLVSDVRRFTIGNLASRRSRRGEHTQRVKQLSEDLFRGLAPLHGLGERAAELLTAAATLHDIGADVDYYRHHKHGAYLIGSVALPGFSHREHALLALLVRYHRKGNPKIGAFEGLLTSEDKTVLQQLTCCLRMAETLERSRAGRVSDLTVEVDEDSISIYLTAEDEPTIELWEGAQHGALFEQAFGRRLVVAVSS